MTSQEVNPGDTLAGVDPTPVSEKLCMKCKRVLPLDDFWRHPTGKFGRHSHCIDCKQAYIKEWRKQNAEKVKAKAKAKYAGLTEAERQAKRDTQRQNYRENSWRWRRDRLLKRYGMTMDDYDLMVRAQGGRCAICGSEAEPHKGLHVDHCHETGTVRGLLCSSCNTGLGHFKDDTARLARAITYLSETQ